MARSFANMSDVKTELAPRGLILDRFGNILVRNEPIYRAFLIPRFLPKDPEGRRATLETLRIALGEEERAFSDRIAHQDWNSYEELLLSSDVPRSQLARLSELTGTWLRLEPAFRRVPSDPLALSHVVGYTGLPLGEDLGNDSDLSPHDEIGKAGLELFYDSSLRGVSGKQIAFQDAQGSTEGFERVREARGGSDIATFLDGELQRYFYDRLEATLLRLDRNVGLGIALDPRNGEVLALVGVPGYDSAHVADFLSAEYDPLFNRAVSGLYNPGSTIKPLHAVAALVEGIISPVKQIFSGGYLEIPNPYFPDQPSRFNDTKPHGWVDLPAALTRSSNVYFYTIGGGFGDQEGLGIERLKRWWQQFRLDQPTGIDLPEEKFGVLPDPRWKEERGEDWRIGDTYNVSIGQGDLLVTPIELATYVSALANGGSFYKPRVMKSIYGDDGAVIEESAPSVLADLREQIRDALPFVREGMEGVASEPYGTAYSLHTLPFPVAAKTGTAQVSRNTKVNALFIGYAPADDPRIALAILIEDAREGSANTIPVAYEVLLWFYENRILE